LHSLHVGIDNSLVIRSRDLIATRSYPSNVLWNSRVRNLLISLKKCCLLILSCQRHQVVILIFFLLQLFQK